MPDVDHGTWPFVTSSHTVAGQAVTGGGPAGQCRHVQSRFDAPFPGQFRKPLPTASRYVSPKALTETTNRQRGVPSVTAVKCRRRSVRSLPRSCGNRAGLRGPHPHAREKI